MTYDFTTPLPRTEEMIQKMSNFRDAGRYPQDEHIDFLADDHVYLLDGVRRLLSVSSLIGHFFEPFDPQAAAKRQEMKTGLPAATFLEKWERIGCLAREVGTFVHEQTENYFQHGRFETLFTFRYDHAEEQVSVEHERQQFLQFVRDYEIEPYRQEWPVYDVSLNLAGTIDMVCQEDDGSFSIYDWKRSSKVCDAYGHPYVQAFADKRSINGINIPDTAYYHYCIQQNLYRYILQRNYGLRVDALNLVVLCPDYATYHVVPVPLMDELIRQIVTFCKEEQLGIRLLK